MNDIDKEIAERVMGWEQLKNDSTTWYDQDGNISYYMRWHPSENIVQAWMVVEKLMEIGLYVDIGCYGKTEYQAYISRGDRGYEWTGSAKTAPLAICKAAIAAVENIELNDSEHV